MDSAKGLIFFLLAFLSLSAWSYGENPGKEEKIFYTECRAGQVTKAISPQALASECASLRTGSEFEGTYRNCPARIKSNLRGQANVWNPDSGSISLFATQVLVRLNSPTCQMSGPEPSEGYFTGFTYDSRVEFNCPVGATQIGTSKVCQCVQGMRPVSKEGKTVCELYTCPPSGTHNGVVPDIGVTNAGQPICNAGCTQMPSSWKAGTDGKIWAVSPFKYSGEFCGGEKLPNGVETGQDKIQPPPVPCGAGQCPGTVNGTPVCVACKSQSTPGPSSAASGVQPDRDPDGQIKKTEKETSCTGSVCTTTTIYRNEGGQIIGEKKDTEPKESFCQQNPTLSICKEGAFGGGCGGFTCNGDPVQCALATEVHRRNCQLYETPNELSSIGDQVMTGQSVPGGHPGSKPSAFNLDALFKPQPGAASCLPDKTVPLMGKQIVLPWSSICDPLKWMGHIAFAFALVHAAFFVFRKL